MELGIKAREIMKQDFPILDSSLTIEACIRRLNGFEACIVLQDGYLHSVVSYEDLLRAFLGRKKKNLSLREIKPYQKFLIVEPETDVIEIINLMREEDIDFFVVKAGNLIGLITKREIAEINQLLFDDWELWEETKMKVAA